MEAKGTGDEQSSQQESPKKSISGVGRKKQKTAKVKTVKSLTTHKVKVLNKVKTAKSLTTQKVKVLKRPAPQPVFKLQRPAKPVTSKMPKSPEHGGKPVHLDTVKIYTDTKGKLWRVQAYGHKKDKSFPFHQKTITKAESWGNLREYINYGKYV
jgi:hypothetical protein